MQICIYIFILVNFQGGKKLSRRSKKEKTAGIEQHKQALREKKMKKKEKKKATISANYRKNK
ncbi:MAG: hypothetical protein QCH99_09680 [Candidatus Bathyarchaeota archaeon]|nr:hypothetical protein [Candidatus Bathyarchaeum tardum]